MEYADILEKWAEYTNYNPNQTSFNLSNRSYELHEINKRIERIVKTYDETGALAIIQAKIMFKRLLKAATINALAYMENPSIIDKDKGMWDIFHCKEVNDIENAYVDAVDELSTRVIGKVLIGEKNKSGLLEDLFEATDVVMASLDKCGKDLFVRGGEILPITRISTHIHLFETLAECLIALEHTDDGLYLCYINCGSTADGYFGFFLKNNGNLLSINERIDEAYSGQHSHSRNGRWAESKQYELFPYNYIFDYTEHDYKGYASKHLIDDEKLAFFELGHRVYFPIIVAMIMINKVYVGKTLDLKVKYVDSLLACNREQLESSDNKLMVIENSRLIESHENINLSFDLDKVMTGDYAKEFDSSSRVATGKDYRETGTFTNSNQFFVDMWGEGFTFDTSKIYKTKSVLRIGNANSEGIPPEYVGTEDRLRLQGYYQLRESLANYIRDKMHDEWIAFGKTEAVEAWYIQQIKKNSEKIEKLLVEKYLAIQNGEKSLGVGCRSADKDVIDIYYTTKRYPEGFGMTILNECKSRYGSEYYCPKTGAICSMFFTIAPKDWKHLELLCGCEVPKIVKGWREAGHFGDGNSILSATDLVTQVGTPFERYEVNRYERIYNESIYEYEFKVAIGYSKRGFKQILNKYKGNR